MTIEFEKPTTPIGEKTMSDVCHFGQRIGDMSDVVNGNVFAAMRHIVSNVVTGINPIVVTSDDGPFATFAPKCFEAFP